MNGYEKSEKIFKALACKSRLQILESVQRGITNPGEMATKLDRDRSTIEKHLRVLLSAGIIEKVPSLTKGGHLTVRYGARQNANSLLAMIDDISKKF